MELRTSLSCRQDLYIMGLRNGWTCTGFLSNTKHWILNSLLWEPCQILSNLFQWEVWLLLASAVRVVQVGHFVLVLVEDIQPKTQQCDSLLSKRLFLKTKHDNPVNPFDGTSHITKFRLLLIYYIQFIVNSNFCKVVQRSRSAMSINSLTKTGLSDYLNSTT